MVKLWLVSATIFGSLSAALEAFGTHSLKNFLDECGKAIHKKTATYHSILDLI